MSESAVIEKSTIPKSTIPKKSASNGAAFDQASALKIFDTGDGGVPLIPLQEVEQHQSTFFWAAIFFGICMASIGSLASLMSTQYANKAVIYIMGLFLGSYLLFTIIFALKGFTRWGRLKKRAVGDSAWNKESMGERVGALERRIQLFKIHRDLGHYVFNGINVLPFEEFDHKLDSLLPFASDDPRRKKFTQRLVSEGIINVDKSNPKSWTATYEMDYDPTI